VLGELLPESVHSLDAVGEVEIVPVTRRESHEHAQWLSLLDSSHYLGAGPLCGAQIRYLVRCRVNGRRHLLGALAFSAAAYRLSCRDRFIEWTESARRKNLQLVVCNSRFLLVPRIKNLASNVLSLSLARLADDWEERYGYRPVLVETFVDSSRFSGSSYRAANWTYVGSTSGRGRQDRDHRAGLEKKAVFVYPLEEDWREKLCVEPVREPRGEFDWADAEFSGADLKDERLNKRLASIARDFFARPTANIPEACGSRAKAKAAYRFCAHEDVTMETILASHYESTVSRIAATAESVVLAIQDMTSVNYTTHVATEGLGPYGSFGAQETRGLLLHSTLAMTPAGTPLGLLDAQCWARDPEEHATARQRRHQPIGEKESRKWLLGYHATEKAQRRLDGKRIVNVADTEADYFELFEFARRAKGLPDLLVRASRTRKIDRGGRDGPFVLDHVRALPVAGRLPIVVPRSGSRPKRETTLELRFEQVDVRSPIRSIESRRAVNLWVIAATEERRPKSGEPIEWLLFTTLPVTTVEEAAEKVSWYALRWQIEVFHRTLKSGCRIEDRQLGTAKSLEACLAVDMVVAWRIFYLTKLGRELTDAPCSVFFEEMQWKALVCFLERPLTMPTKPPTLKEATRMIASLGGFIGGPKENPGTQTMWRGLQRLDDIELGFTTAMKMVAGRTDTS